MNRNEQRPRVASEPQGRREGTTSMRNFEHSPFYSIRTAFALATVLFLVLAIGRKTHGADTDPLPSPLYGQSLKKSVELLKDDTSPTSLDADRGVRPVAKGQPNPMSQVAPARVSVTYNYTCGGATCGDVNTCPPGYCVV